MTEVEALREMLEQKQKIIAVMAYDLFELGVNFDFAKALDRWEALKKLGDEE